MKLIIEQQLIASDFRFAKNEKELYEKFYKEDGWSFDEEVPAIYYEAEVPFMPVEGQRICTISGVGIVCYSIYHIKEGTDYLSKNRIVVKDE